MKIKFSYNFNKEAENWYNIASFKKDTYGIPYKETVIPISKDILKYILAHNKKNSITYIEKFLRSDPRRELKNIFIQQKIRSLEKIWSELGDKLIFALNQVTGKQLINQEYTAYITNLFICDYNYKKQYFFLSLHHSDALNFSVIAHELLHFITYDYFQAYCLKRGLSGAKFQDLKECLTVILNSENFKNLLLIEDIGYKTHTKLRTLLLQKYSEGLSFKDLIDLGIAYLLKEERRR